MYKWSESNLWTLLHVLPVAVCEELNAFVATSVHYVAICFEKQYNGMSPQIPHAFEEQNATWKMCNAKPRVTPCY